TAPHAWPVGHRTPTVGTWIVSATIGDKGARGLRSSPNNHLRSGPHETVSDASGRGVDRAGCRPGVGGWIVSATCVGEAVAIAAPDDHFAAGPNTARETGE